MFTGYWLDDYTFICKAYDVEIKDYKWVEIKTILPKEKDGTIRFDDVSQKAFDIEIIDPNNFYWNGKRLTIKDTIEV